jgi:GNAT superfamily N-acetyltransferase
MIRFATLKDAAAIAAVHVDTWRSTYAGIVPDAYLSSLSIDQRARYWQGLLSDNQRPSSILVAEMENKVVGFACAGPERTGDVEHKGEIYALYLLPEHQSQGLGRGLFLAAMDCLIWSGLGSLLVWVLVDNPHRGFYEKLGGARVRSRVVEVGGVPLTEVAYGWRTIAGMT